MNNTMKTGAKIGAAVGVIFWMLFGILGGFYFGGYGAISILSKLTGSAVEATLINRAFIVAGMMVGITAAGSVCLVVGGLVGAAFGWIVSPVKNLAASYSKE
jgi:hypothetical protein